MLQRLPTNIQGWATYFDHASLPVLRHTVVRLAEMREDLDSVSGHDIAEVVLHDPLMTLKVIRYIQAKRMGQSSRTEITTIDHALMMLGLTPFFRHFSELSIIEDALAQHPLALEGVRHVILRARHAACFASDWAMLRVDREVEEVEVAALQHHLVEILMWVYAPEPMIRMTNLLKSQTGMRSADAQVEVFGFKLNDLQLKLVAQWHLPQLLRSLMDDTRTLLPRQRCALLAVALARHHANGWEDPALPDDYQSIAKLLGLSEEGAIGRIQRVAGQVANELVWYGEAKE
ncbi:MAG: HDOD domain-containing protein [Sulfuricellaceae bacterium]|nr:HDOD domain-containing protein [Sulfuricellaceae bacterium]